MSGVDELFPCVGICLPDEDEAYCIGCGRPWGEPRPQPAQAPAPQPAKDESEAPPA